MIIQGGIKRPINQLLKDNLNYDAKVRGEALHIKKCTQYTNAGTPIIIKRM